MTGVAAVVAIGGAAGDGRAALVSWAREFAARLGRRRVAMRSPRTLFVLAAVAAAAAPTPGQEQTWHLEVVGDH